MSTDLFVDLTAEVSGEDLDSLFDAWFSDNARSHRFARPFEGVKVLAKHGGDDRRGASEAVTTR